MYLKAVDNLTINIDSQQQTEIIRNQQALAIEMQTKDREIHELKEQILKMGNVMERLDSSVKFWDKKFMRYRDQHGSLPLTKAELKKLNEMEKWLKAHPDTNGEAD